MTVFTVLGVDENHNARFTEITGDNEEAVVNWLEEQGWKNIELYERRTFR